MKKTYKVVWTTSAQEDLRLTIDYISKENPQTAIKLFHKIRTQARKLYRYPERGRRLPELSFIKGLPYRELIISPWRLIYRIKDKRINVLAFLDSRRDLEELLYERLSRMP
jgi:addiction module RelE/StbE family toxin